MVKIRLARIGSKNRPKYRVVVANEQASRSGSFIEIIGRYDTSAKPAEFAVDKERLTYWLGVGAQPTESVAKLLIQNS